MAVEDCPLPEVAEALAPYIKSREEVTNIRRGLQSHLQNQLEKNGDDPLSAVNLTEPTQSPPGPPPQSLTGVRKAYWKALQAHQAAQAKYDGLRTELEQIKRHKGASAEDSRPRTSVNDDYIPLLRQREKHRRLKVIDSAVGKITSTGGEISSLEDIVKKRIDELPAPPSTQPSFNRNPQVDAKVMELKRAVVSTKRKVDDTRTRARVEAGNGTAELSPQAQIAGLQKALQELTVWMESQLAVIANAESEPPTDSETPGAAPNKIEDIEPLYAKYLEARQRLVENINNAGESSDMEAETPFEFHNNPSSATSKTTPAGFTVTPAETLLPFLPALVAAKQGEQALMQQNAYIRRRISAAEDETARLVRRLADESHLVPPGASGGRDWAEAAGEAGSATEEFIRQRLEAGRASATTAEVAMEKIQSLPERLKN